jgi:hypothetical protein
MDFTIPADGSWKTRRARCPSSPATLRRWSAHSEFLDYRREHARTRFEHVSRHHRRYWITEGCDEIRIRHGAGIVFGREAKHGA